MHLVEKSHLSSASELNTYTLVAWTTDGWMDRRTLTEPTEPTTDDDARARANSIDERVRL